MALSDVVVIITITTKFGVSSIFQAFGRVVTRQLLSQTCEFKIKSIDWGLYNKAILCLTSQNIINNTLNNIQKNIPQYWKTSRDNKNIQPK